MICIDHDIPLVDEKCPMCAVLLERDAALDKVAQLEFEVAELEEKIRLLEAAL